MSDHKWVTANLIYLSDYCEECGLQEVADVLVDALERVAPILAGSPTYEPYNVVGEAKHTAQETKVFELGLA